MLGEHFEDVEVLGLDGNAEVRADFEARRKTANRLLKLDVLDLRHRLPETWFIALHATARRLVYGIMGSRWSGGSTGIDDSAFQITESIDPSTLVLFAVARRPKR
jgi:hypothetical protein